MKRAILLTLLCTGCTEEQSEVPPPPVDETKTGRVVARVTDLRNSKGRVIARLYRGKTGFPSKKEAAFREKTFKILDGKTTALFNDVPHGEYALWICHDENSNGKLDSNFLGMPKEGVGVSGPPPSMIPKYRDARFVLGSAVSEHSIALKYL